VHVVVDPNLANLHGKTALVTGGSRGLGRVMAEGLSRAGASVMLASRDGDRCREVAAQITQETGGRVLGRGCHVGRWAELDGLVDAAYDELGGLDVLINNAGMSPLYPDLASITEDLFDKVLAVNLKGPFRLAALVGARMAADGGGSIINVSSVASLHPRPEALVYAAAKAGLNSLTEGLAHAFGPTVRVNAVLPGTFLTDVSEHWDMDAFGNEVQRFALGRAADAQEILGTILYLASNASSYTTAALIGVHGGYR
jgi:NAD(P)-dependent dehydrogenase (short-subunit alcohol dehydrogenase family)